MKPLSLLIALLFKGLSWIEHLEFINLNWYIHSIELATLLIAALLMWVLLPIKPFNFIALLWVYLPFFPPRTIIHSGEALVHVLDVGQGLAVVVLTNIIYYSMILVINFFKEVILGRWLYCPISKKQE